MESESPSLLRTPRGRSWPSRRRRALSRALLVGIGYLLGAEWDRAADTIGALSKPLLAAVLVAGGGWLLWTRLRDR